MSKEAKKPKHGTFKRRLRDKETLHLSGGYAKVTFYKDKSGRWSYRICGARVILSRSRS